MTLEIKLRAKEKPEDGWHDAVMHFFKDCPADKYNFTDCDFRINGVEYTKSTAEFIKVIEQDAIWKKLSD